MVSITWQNSDKLPEIVKERCMLASSLNTRGGHPEVLDWTNFEEFWEIKRGRKSSSCLSFLFFRYTVSLHVLAVVEEFTMLSTASLALLWATGAVAHSGHNDQTPAAGPHQSLWYNTLPGDGGTQVGPGSPFSIPWKSLTKALL